MKYYNAILMCMMALVAVGTAHASTDQPFGYKTVCTGLTIPWEIEFGPDSLLWVTERPGLMSQVDVATGAKHVLLDLRDEVFTKQESGMLGFCFHPNFADTPWVFVAYLGGSEDHMVRVVNRYTYNGDSLVDPVRIFTLDPAGFYHQGCRLYIDEDRKLWVTMGDNPGFNLAVVDTSVAGKLLRMNLDGSVPDDNPVPGQLFWSKGHRNIQGFTQLPNGRIWTSEHGNIIEDEVNLIEKGGNYGWPYVEGVCDLPDEITYCDSAHVIQPKWSTGQTTFAPSGLQYYNHEKYPSLKNSLLQCFLKSSKLMQFTLNEEGDSIIATREYLNNSMGRIRDIAIDASGRIFLCTSNREPNGFAPFPLTDDDRIVELIEYPEACVPNFKIPDTVRISAVPGFPREFSIRVENLTDCPNSILFVWNLDPNEDLKSTQWRAPVVLAANQSFDSQAYFEPLTDSIYHQTVLFGLEGSPGDTTYLIGDTQSGMMSAKNSSMTVFVRVHSELKYPITFYNVGNEPTTVLGADVQGDFTDGFEVVSQPSGIIQPGDSLTVMLHVQFPIAGTFNCTLHLQTDAYVSPSVQVTALCSPTESVHVDPSSPPLLSYPNPFASQILISVPSELVGGVATVINELGAVVWTGQVTGDVITWFGVDNSNSMLPPGPYYLSIRKNQHVRSCALFKHDQ